MIRHIALQTQHGSLHGRLGLPEHPRGLILVVRAHRLDDDELAAAEFEARGTAWLIAPPRSRPASEGRSGGGARR